METPQVDEFVMWMGGMAAALVAVSAGMIVLKKFLLGQLYSDIEDVRSQLHRNSGTSLRDAVQDFRLRCPGRCCVVASDLRNSSPRCCYCGCRDPCCG